MTVPTKRKCPHCDFETDDEKIRCCPRDGMRLATPKPQVQYFDAFISYRREGGDDRASLIATALRNPHELNVFLDRDELEVGKAFPQRLEEIIAATPNFVLLLTPGALDRCQNEGDWLRREIAAALRASRAIIPVTDKRFVWPKAEELPEEIRVLASIHGTPYDNQFRDESIDRIVKFIRRNLHTRGVIGTGLVRPSSNPRAIVPAVAEYPKFVESNSSVAGPGPVLTKVVPIPSKAAMWPDAYISYRHKGGNPYAQAIRASLQFERGLNVFVDVNELNSGKFDESLLAKIEAAPNFVLILSEGALDRCSHEDDWLRREIAHALKHKRQIIPVLLEGFQMPKAETLPAEIRELARWQAVRYDDAYAMDALNRIGEWCRTERSLHATESTPLRLPESPHKPEPSEPALAPVVEARQKEVPSPTSAAPKVPTPGQNWTVPGIGLEMIWIEPGIFVMGSPEGETGRSTDETQHCVTLTKGFWLGRCPVTQRQWQELVGRNPSHFVTGKVMEEGGRFTERMIISDSSSRPVEQVSWEECVACGRQLTEAERAANRLPGGLAYMLPTEAQWEYACRAGSGGPYAGTGAMDEMGWYVGNSGGRTHPVGRKTPNRWGLHDMHGNVWEWCMDWRGVYKNESETDPLGSTSGAYRVFRGGSWFSIMDRCRSPCRSHSGPGYRSRYLGFRLALSSVGGDASKDIARSGERNG